MFCCYAIDNNEIVKWFNRVVNIAATAMVTEAATALFGEAGVTAATGVMTVSDIVTLVSTCPTRVGRLN